MSTMKPHPTAQPLTAYRSPPLSGKFSLPGDKSISHRALMLSAMTIGESKISGLLESADVFATAAAMRAYGANVERGGDGVWRVSGLGPGGLLEPDGPIDFGNAGTGVRLTMGIAAAHPFASTFIGDASLSRRPMDRVLDPLRQMGADVIARSGDRLPLSLRGAEPMAPITYRVPIASAQVKSALLLAGLASHCSVIIRENSFTRDHTERMLAEIGEGIETRKIKPVAVDDQHDPRKKKMVMPEPFKYEARLSARASVKGGEINIPGDISTASFFMAAAAITGGTLTIENVGLNPTRTAFIDHLKAIGCEVNIFDKKTITGEPRGTVTVSGSKLKPRKISGDTTVGLIDEIPLVAILAAFTEGTTVIRDAAELKVKESNRLEAIHHNLNLAGAKYGLLDDGLAIEGGRELSGADFVGFADHRIVMAFSIAALSLAGPSTIDDDSPASVSCPGFYDILEQIIK